MDYDREHLPRDESLPWPAGGGLDRAYRAQIRDRLRAGRTLVQAELKAFVAVAPAYRRAELGEQLRQRGAALALRSARELLAAESRHVEGAQLQPGGDPRGRRADGDAGGRGEVLRR